MVRGSKPVIGLEKMPIPRPDVVCLVLVMSVVSGSIVVLQQTPVKVTAELPLVVTSPPLVPV